MTNTLCFMSNLTSAEWAAWVQAIGSIGAIIAAVLIATRQTKQQYQTALDLQTSERHAARAELAKTLSVLATNSSKAMKHISAQLSDRESVHRAGEGELPCDIGEIDRLDTYIANIPLQTLPHSLVTLTMILGATVRQFRAKVEMTLRLHRQMDAGMFDDFFLTLRQMNASIEETCKDIAAKVEEQT